MKTTLISKLDIKDVSMSWNTFVPSKPLLSIKGPLGISTIDTKKLDKKGLVVFHKTDFTLSVKKKRAYYKEAQINIKKKSLIKTICSLIKNEIVGVSQGYLLHLDIVGIGYKVTINKQSLFFKLGFSHKIKYELPENVRAFSTKANHLCLYSISWSMLKQTAAKIKALKNPEPYKGKGIRYRGEIINLKIGKRK